MSVHGCMIELDHKHKLESSMSITDLVHNSNIAPCLFHAVNKKKGDGTSEADRRPTPNKKMEE